MAQGGKRLLANRLQVGPGPLDEHGSEGAAPEVLHLQLEGRVAAAPQDQGRLGPDEPALVHQQVQAVQAGSFAVVPEVAHAVESPWSGVSLVGRLEMRPLWRLGTRDKISVGWRGGW